jgi:hypothetical protein
LCCRKRLQVKNNLNFWTLSTGQIAGQSPVLSMDTSERKEYT